MSLDDLVDLDRYPIHELEGSAAQALVTECRDALRSEGACRLDGFVRADAVERMADEAGDLAAAGYPNDAAHNCYFDDEIDESLPEDHPRRIHGPLRAEGGRDGPPARRTSGRGASMRRTRCSRSSPPPWRRTCCYRSADPLDGVNMTVYEQGDELGWHFDQSEFSVTLMIQRSQAGGEFEYAPMVRTPDDERYDAVRSVLIGDTPAKNLASDPGTLAFFRGRYSLHRVPPVVGSTPRMNSVLTYSVEPGHMLSEMAQRMYYGRTALA